MTWNMKRDRTMRTNGSLLSGSPKGEGRASGSVALRGARQRRPVGSGRKRGARMTGVAATVDAIVVATSAAAGGGVVLTSDITDIRTLASCAAGIRIRPVRV